MDDVFAAILRTLRYLSILSFLMLCGCSHTTYVPVEEVRTEYRDRDVERVVADTVRESRVVWVRGDTVVDVRERWSTRLEYVHDTVSVIRRDSVPVPYAVERKLSRWEQAKMDLGGWAIGAVVVAAGAAVWGWRRR